MMKGVPTNMKYALIEREQRFLLAALPEQLYANPRREVHDRYLQGTQLRLRVVEEPGRDPIRKLGQKIRLAETPPPTAIAQTSMYLDRGDYETLLALPAAELHKTRRVTHLGGMTVAVDEFHGDLEGLILAEVDLGEHADPLTELAIPYLVEVTGDERFTGGMLAITRSDALSTLLNMAAGPTINDSS
jgi:CYTH domain-containing protein